MVRPGGSCGVSLGLNMRASLRRLSRARVSSSRGCSRWNLLWCGCGGDVLGQLIGEVEAYILPGVRCLPRVDGLRSGVGPEDQALALQHGPAAVLAQNLDADRGAAHYCGA